MPVNTNALRVAAIIISLLPITRVAVSIQSDWQGIRGWEAYWVASALAEGRGYSFHSSGRWLFDDATSGGYFPTAWVDPLYTYCLAGLIYLFDSYHQLAAGVFNLLLLAAVFALTYRVAERLATPLGGVIAISLLALEPFSVRALQMNNTMLAAFFVALSALSFIRFLDRPVNTRAVLLGVILGLTVLACPNAQLFIPVAVLWIFFWGRAKPATSLAQGGLVLVLALAVMLPWAVRNYAVFGEIVPVRTGAGLNAFIGVVATAATVAPETLAPGVKPEWQARTPRSAVFEALGDEKRRALTRFESYYAHQLAPPDYAEMNEAQRDKWFLKETLRFLETHPILSLQLALFKLEVFIRSMGLVGIVVFFLALVASVPAWSNPAAMSLGLWAAAYLGPFALIICYFGRYRAPVEPLLVVLAAFSLIWAVKATAILLGTRTGNPA